MTKTIEAMSYVVIHYKGQPGLRGYMTQHQRKFNTAKDRVKQVAKCPSLYKNGPRNTGFNSRVFKGYITSLTIDGNRVDSLIS